MKFFIPGVNDIETNKIYASIKKFVLQQTGRSILNDHVYSISFNHNNKEFTATVGENVKFSPNEIVVCILKSNDLYFICTPSNGVKSGNPILVNKEHIILIENFDS